MLAATVAAQAQDTYLNDRITAQDELNGSARYVGMGGAMGALGADLSVISSNPAGIALYRKSDVGLSFGCVLPNGNGWDSKQPATYGEKLNRASFDQLGLVWSLRTGNDMVRFVNFGINYQKRKNFNTGFFADNYTLNGLSQMDQLADMANAEMGGLDNTNLVGLAEYPYENDENTSYLAWDDQGNYYNAYPSYSSNYTRHQVGAVQGFDFNASLNLQDRVYLGMTVGVDGVNYKSWSEYAEYGSDNGLNHGLYNDRKIEGSGVNVKLGMIVRPSAESPFRIGVTMETPTWYRLHNSTLYNLYADLGNGVEKSDQPESYLDYTVRTPWKGRLSFGTTIGTSLAIGAEYEIANYSKTAMGYPIYKEHDEYSDYRSHKDVAMNNHTRDNLHAQHTIKVGAEYKPTKNLALRAGYNFISSRFKKDCTFDQYAIYQDSGNYYMANDEISTNYITNTDYSRIGAANIVTLGIGYSLKSFYINAAYQMRAQKADFYGFHANKPGVEYTTANQLNPVEVNLNRHQLTFGLGFKF